MGARFQVEDIFWIEGRGRILAGRLVKGEIERGMSISVPDLGSPLVVDGIDFIRRKDIESDSVGLTLREDATGTVEELKPLLVGKTVEVE